MEPERRRQILLAVLAIVLVIVVYREWPRTAGQAAAPSNDRGAAAAAKPAARPAPSSSAPAATAPQQARADGRSQAPSGAPEVHLDALKADRPKPSAVDRNLFRFKPKAPPPAPARETRPPADTRTAPPEGPPQPAAPAPIALKFIGVVEQAPGRPKIALLRDAQGNVFEGSEGQTIEGRWRILRIGVESIEMAYLDGRGRQTIRLTGS